MHLWVRSRFIAGLIFILVSSGLVFKSRILEHAELAFHGETAENFSALDNNANLFELYRQNSAQAVVLISYGIGCPIVRKNIPLINELSQKLSVDGVRFFMLDAMPQDSRKELAAEANSFSIRVPILADQTQEISKSLGIKRTAEALLIETKTWKIIFRGPVDDRLGYGIEKPKSKVSYLANAIQQFLSHREISPENMPSLGCAISFEPVAKCNYYGQVAQIVQSKCAQCHSPGGVAPTNLWTYQDLRGWGTMLKEVLRTDRMPPWEVTFTATPLKWDPALSIEEKKTIYQWIDSGFPMGNEADKPPPAPPRKHIASDILLRTRAPVQIPGQTANPWHYELLMSNNPEDIWISKYDFEVSNRSVIQHMALVIMKKPMDLSKNVFEPEYHQDRKNFYGIMRWSAQSDRATILPEGLAYRIPKDSNVYLELHFGPTGKPETESVTVQLEKYKEFGSPKETKYMDVSLSYLTIPPNVETHTLTARYLVARDLFISRMGAHMHWRGKAARVWEIRPNGQRDFLFSQRYIFKNRTDYSFKEPLLIKAGSTIEVESDYDNSISNPAAIDHNQWVYFGPDPFVNEMATMHLQYYFRQSKVAVFGNAQ